MRMCVCNWLLPWDWFKLIDIEICTEYMLILLKRSNTSLHIKSAALSSALHCSARWFASPAASDSVLLQSKGVTCALFQPICTWYSTVEMRFLLFWTVYTIDPCFNYESSDWFRLWKLMWSDNKHAFMMHFPCRLVNNMLPMETQLFNAIISRVKLLFFKFNNLIDC